MRGEPWFARMGDELREPAGCSEGVGRSGRGALIRDLFEAHNLEAGSFSGAGR